MTETAAPPEIAISWLRTSPIDPKFRWPGRWRWMRHGRVGDPANHRAVVLQAMAVDAIERHLAGKLGPPDVYSLQEAAYPPAGEYIVVLAEVDQFARRFAIHAGILGL